jgi:hypothetical protein
MKMGRPKPISAHAVNMRFTAMLAGRRKSPLKQFWSNIGRKEHFQAFLPST